MIINKAKKLFFYLKKTYFTLRNMDPFDPSPIRPKVEGLEPEFLIPRPIPLTINWKILEKTITSKASKELLDMPFPSRRGKIIITLLGAGLLLTLARVS